MCDKTAIYLVRVTYLSVLFTEDMLIDVKDFTYSMCVCIWLKLFNVQPTRQYMYAKKEL